MRVLLWVVVLLFPVSESALGVFKRANPRDTDVEDKGSLALLGLVITASLAVAIGCLWLPSARIGISGALRAWVALGVMIAGLGIRWVAILTLGRLFTVNVAIHADHTLVQTGLYRYVRHPSYSGLLLAFLGLGVFFANWLSIVALVVPISLAVFNRIAKEEAALLRALGPPYAAYCARTKRLVPGVF